MKDLLKKHDLAYRTEKSYRNQREKMSQRGAYDKPTNTISSQSSLPDTLDEIDLNPSRYQHALIKNSDRHYLTNDPHKEYPYHEKNDLGSIYSKECADATNTWRNEYAQSRARNRRHSHKIEIL